jgi:hypothetical protein
MKATTLLLISVLTLQLGACMAQSVTGPKSVQLTVYNGGFALVRDTRGVTLKKGINSIEVEDVAAKIDPTSVLFKTLTAPNSVTILEQNYQYDLISPDNILNKSVGQRVTFTSFDSNGKPYTQTGVLLAPPANGGVVIKMDDGSMVLRPEGQVSLQKMPDGLHPKPTLNWLLEADRAGDQDAQISYITNGIGWKADYVALVNKDDTALDLTGWVTLDNRCGATYTDAELTLMAGDVRRVQPFDLDNSIVLKGGEMGIQDFKQQFQEQSFFEYHMYTMERPTTIRDNETKQLSLLSASGAAVTKEMIYDGRKQWWNSWWYEGRTDFNPGGGYDTSTYHKVNVVLEAKNSQANHMGMPLPKGRIRVYKLDNTGAQQFVGEDNIDHTPKDEKIRLYVGDAFDVVGDYKRTDFKKIDDRTIEETFQVNVRNHKETPVEVKVIDHVWSDWKVNESSAKYTKKDAHTIEFPIQVPKDGETVVTYTIRTKW